MHSGSATRDANSVNLTPKIYRIIQLATVMFLIGLVIGVFLRGGGLAA